MNTGLIVVGVLVVLLVALLVYWALTPWRRGIYIDPRRVKQMRRLHDHERAHAERQRRD